MNVPVMMAGTARSQWLFAVGRRHLPANELTGDEAATHTATTKGDGDGHCARNVHILGKKEAVRERKERKADLRSCHR